MNKKWLGVSLVSFLFVLFAGNSCYANQEAIFSITVPNATLQLTVPESASLEFTPTSSATLKNTTIDINVGTNNITGYTLTMTPESSDDDYQTSLIGTSNKTARIDTLATEVSGYTDASFTTNRWGYRLGSEGNYFAVPATLAPTSWITDGPANSSTKSLTLAAKIDGYQAADTYTTKLVFHAVTNAVPYEVIYNANTTDTVTDLPTDQSGTTYGEVTLSSTKPSRGDYGFFGWCTQATEGATCPGTTYRAGQTVQLDGAVGGTLNLYAIWGTYAELDTGANINMKIKTLASNTEVTSTSTIDNSIKAFKRANSMPSEPYNVNIDTISLSDSTHSPVYAWFDNTNSTGTIYYYTEADYARMNSDSSRMFLNSLALMDISGLSSFDASTATTISLIFAGNNPNNQTHITDLSPLSEWDTSNITSLTAAFQFATSLTTLHGLEKWNTSNVQTMNAMFLGYDEGEYNAPMHLSDISALANWDTSGVTSLNTIFQACRDLTDISALANWDTSNVTDMGYMFASSNSLSDISPLANWDTSKVTTIKRLFAASDTITNISALANWNTSNVVNMQGVFQNATSLSDISPLANWDTSKVTVFESIFQLCSIADISSLANWDTSSAINMHNMFVKNGNLYNISGVRDWDVSKVEDMYAMFYGTQIDSLSSLTNWNTSSLKNAEYMFGKTNITNLDAISTGQRASKDYISWDVSSVESMKEMFASVTTLSDISGIANWDVSNVTNMSNMFAEDASIVDASSINDWDISSVTNFSKMFSGVPVHPEFTVRTGTWGTDGTFTPDI